MFKIDEYLNSSNFSNLCLAMDFLDEDIDEIKKKAAQIKEDFENSIALIIYEQLLKYRKLQARNFSLHSIITGGCHPVRGFPVMNFSIKSIFVIMMDGKI